MDGIKTYVLGTGQETFLGTITSNADKDAFAAAADAALEKYGEEDFQGDPAAAVAEQLMAMGYKASTDFSPYDVHDMEFEF